MDSNYYRLLGSFGQCLEAAIYNLPLCLHTLSSFLTDPHWSPKTVLVGLLWRKKLQSWEKESHNSSSKCTQGIHFNFLPGSKEAQCYQPIISLWPLNAFIGPKHFQMETLATVLQTLSVPNLEHDDIMGSLPWCGHIRDHAGSLIVGWIHVLLSFSSQMHAVSCEQWCHACGSACIHVTDVMAVLIMHPAVVLNIDTCRTTCTWPPYANLITILRKIQSSNNMWLVRPWLYGLTYGCLYWQKIWTIWVLLK